MNGAKIIPGLVNLRLHNYGKIHHFLLLASHPLFRSMAILNSKTVCLPGRVPSKLGQESLPTRTSRTSATNTLVNAPVISSCPTVRRIVLEPPSLSIGKRLHSELERSTIFNGKIHYFHSHFQ